jgi:hypothetical protein
MSSAMQTPRPDLSSPNPLAAAVTFNSGASTRRARRKRQLSFPPSGATPCAALAAAEGPSPALAVTTTSRPKKRRRLVKFGKATVVGRATSMDRACTPPEIFACDGCGRTLESGLRGFEVYASCAGCGDYDLCFACCDNGDAARRGDEPPAAAAHACADPRLVVVDRNLDVRPDPAPAAL